MTTLRNPSNPSGLSSIKCIPLRPPEDPQLSRKKEAILSKFSEECLKPFPPGNVRKPNKRTLLPRSCQTKPSQSLSQLFDTPSRVVKPMLEAAKTVQLYIEIISEFGLVNRKSQHAGDLPPLTGWNIVRSHELHVAELFIVWLRGWINMVWGRINCYCASHAVRQLLAATADSTAWWVSCSGKEQELGKSVVHQTW